MKHGVYAITNAVQEDVLLAMVPISNTTIFFNSLLEFTWCAPFTTNGRIHANGSIYTGTSSSSYLEFNDPAKQPPGMPCALLPVRFDFAVPPPNTVTYNVTP